MSSFSITNNFYAYRGNTGSGNYEVLDFSMFGSGTHIAQKILLIPDADAIDIKINNQTFTCRIEGAWDTDYPDMNLQSVKIIQPNVNFYVAYYIS